MRDLAEMFADLDLLEVPEMRSDVDTRIADGGFPAAEVPVRPVPTPRWKGPLIAVGTAAAILVVAIGSLLLLRGDEADVVEEPVSTTLVPPATPTTLVPPATTVPVTEATRTVVGEWNPILSTTVAREAPAAATCPDGTNPDVPGPVDQERPEAGSNGNLTAVFDRHAGRIVYVDTHRKTWTFDVCTNTWHRMNPTGAPIGRGDLQDPGGYGLVYDVDSDVTVAFGFEHISVYDANANEWTQLSDDAFGIYDANTNTWTKPSNDAIGIGADLLPFGAVYDSVSGLIITSTLRLTSETDMAPAGEFWAYDVDTNEWTLLGDMPPETGRDLDSLGYSEQLDRLIVYGGPERTILVDPRTGDVTVLPIDSPYIDYAWPTGTYVAADGTVYTTARTTDNSHYICGFDANVKSWTACFDIPGSVDIAPLPFPILVGDPINNRLVVITPAQYVVGRNGAVVFDTGRIGAIGFDTGEWIQLLDLSTP